VPPSDLERIFAALEASGARYLVVGGVDLFVEEPFAFEAAWARRLRAELGAVTVDVASLEDLIEMKRRAGRPQDLADVRELKAIARELQDRSHD
jgi:hypothetical protein